MSNKNTPSKKTAAAKSPAKVAKPLDTDAVVNESGADEAAETTEDAPKKGKGKAKAKANFGNMDKEQKYDLSGLVIPDDHYVVRHFSTIALGDGVSTIEDPTSNRFQVYDQKTFDALSKQPVIKGKQYQSQFEDLGMNVDVLHDPS